MRTRLYRRLALHKERVRTSTLERYSLRKQRHHAHRRRAAIIRET